MSEQQFPEFDPEPEDDSLDIAIIGVAGRFPKASTVEQFWQNLRAGVCSATEFGEQELLDRGVSASTLSDPSFVPVGYLLEDSDKFDAAFFGYSPREAELMDPQQRVLLECAWAALEGSGHDPQRYDGLIGVYAGAGNNTYLLLNIASRPDAVEVMGGNQLVIGNRSDFLTTRVSYKLGLRGPSFNIQSACSTSLVAVAQASQALLSYQCDMALAGGVAVDVMRRDGYTYRPDGIFSSDGRCRTFDRRANGTVGGEGVGMVVLKRLQDALADRDHIHAVIKGSAVNNDGAERAGFSAPSATSQASVIASALANADVEPDSVRLVETHGTATALGDPIEVKALASVYTGLPTSHCALGSVKTNIGHLDSAAGIAGLIKTVLAVEHGEIPPTLHFEQPNPRLELADSPFYVNTGLVSWPVGEGPRRAAVSSFGLGGTNAHVIVEQAPIAAPSLPKVDREQLLVLSAKSPEALEAVTDRLRDHLRAHPELRLADVAFTLQQGRRALPYRRTAVCEDIDDALNVLDAPDGGRLLTGLAPDMAHRPVAFMFTGFGAQYPSMARALRDSEPVFQEALARCAKLLEPLLGQDILDVMHPASGEPAPAGASDAFRRMLLQPTRSEHPLDQPQLGYAAMFALEYSLAELWESWGVQPDAMIGHSLGEYVAACRSGVFCLEDALHLVVERARLIEEQGEGAMVAVPLSEEEALRHTNDAVALAAVNGPQTCVLSGTLPGIAQVEADLAAAGVPFRRLNTRYAFHSPLMDPVVEPYAALVRKVRLNPPTTPFVSNMSGTWITDEEATNPAYWASHVRRTVRFAAGIATLWGRPDLAMVEVGPGQTLTTGALQHPEGPTGSSRTVVPSLPGMFDSQSDRATMLAAAAKLWMAGREHPFPDSPVARRVPLPTYPFERRAYWLEPAAAAAERTVAKRRARSTDWFYAPSWTRLGLSPAPASALPQAGMPCRLVFADGTGLGRAVADRLREAGERVCIVTAGEEWAEAPGNQYTLDPARPDHYARLAAALKEANTVPDRVLHCWSVGGDADRAGAELGVETLLDLGFRSLLHWAQATESDLMSRPQRWDVLSSDVFSVTGDEPLCPPKAAVQGICKVLPQEYPPLTCVHLDLDLTGSSGTGPLVDQVLAELAAPAAERTLALRGAHRWAPTYMPHLLRPNDGDPTENGVYLITGGLGKIGLLAARALAERTHGHLVLLGRTALPPRATWADPGHSDEVRSLVRAIAELEELGATVTVVAADVSDPVRMREVRDEILAVHGRINGLVHCAGTTGAPAHRVIADLGAEEASWHFAPKLAGAYVLHDVLADQELDFAILCSSIASLLGGLGFAAYSAANAVLDAFAQAHHRPGQPWTSVNWEAWNFVEKAESGPGIGDSVQEFALTPAEGRQVIDALLSAVPEAQVVVSTGDVAKRYDEWADPAVATTPAVRRHERPNLRNPFVAPEGEMEQRVAAVWQELLGVESVGANDNFFELGGSSLLGLQVVHRLRQDLALAVPLTVVYEGPTIRTLGRLIEELRAEQ
ncbi:type I polyketide synthase [Streptomyces cyaneofuscatus]|uniref:type I polyketide synthase n=1 Tax=Streptomyces cyaneofuscatus TaxID=66883 RepID=UPI00378AC5B7